MTHSIAAPRPLRHRLANPPPIFVGREAALEHLQQALERGPVVLVCAPGGYGKSALVRRALAGRRDSASVVEVRPDDTVAELLASVEAALGVVGGTGTLDDALAAAEATGETIVVEDAHLLAPATLTKLAGALADYARRSTWVVTSRTLPTMHALQEQIVRLEPLSEDAAEALARQLDPALEDADVARIVAAADGSPLVVRRLVGAEAARDPATLSLIEALAHVRSALATEDVSQVADVPARAVLEALLEAGVLTGSADRFRLHDAVREEHQRRTTRRQRARLAEGLGGSSDPEARLEALRAHVDTGDAEAARALVARHRGEWSGATALRAWRLLKLDRAGAYAGAAIVLAEAAQTTEALLWAARQPDPGGAAEDRLAWLAARARVHGLPAVTEDARRLAAELTGSEGFEAALVAARGDLYGGHLARAKESLEALEPSSDGQELRAKAALARATWLLGLTGEARDMLAELRPRLEAQPETTALVDLHQLQTEADERPADGQETFETPTTPGEFWQLVVRMIDSAMGARLDVARRALDAAEAFDAPGPLERMPIVMTHIALAIADGPTEALSRWYHEALRMAGGCDAWAAVLWLHVGALGASWFLDEPVPDLPWPESLPPPAGPPARYREAMAALLRRDTGEPVEAPESLTRPVSDPFLSAGQAMWSVLDGDVGRAAILANTAAAQAEASGAGLAAALGRGFRCLALMDMGRQAELEVALAELQRRTERYGAAATSAGTALISLGGANHPELRVLLDIIGGRDRAPLAARWGRQLALGRPGPRRFDAWVVAALRRRRPELELGRVEPPGATWDHGWGVDLVTGHVVLPDGRVVDLSRASVSRRLLATLVAGGGSASKETLVMSVWDRSEYHPLQDDTRLHVAMNRLRKAIEADPAAPERVVTTDSGYAVGSTTAFTWLRAASPDEA